MASEFAVHENPVWRARSNFIVHAEVHGINDDIGTFEQLWTRRLGERLFEVCCIPFFIYDVSLGDHVETYLRKDMEFVVSRVVLDAGHVTFRTYFPTDPLAANRTRITQRKTIDLVTDHGGLYEWSTKGLLAIDAPCEHAAEIIFDFLSDQEVKGKLRFENGRSR